MKCAFSPNVKEFEIGMSPVMDLQQGHVLIADMVEFSERSAREQAALVEDFVGLLEAALAETLTDVALNVFPTGDGAIIATYGETVAEVSHLAPRVFDLALSLLRGSSNRNYAIKVSINSSVHEALIDVSSSGQVHANVIQIGNGINLAERILNFAEPREIVVTDSFREALKNADPAREYTFRVQSQVFVKHMRSLNLNIYQPSNEEKSFVAEPRESRNRHHKRYAYFPPMKESTLDRFRAVGLETDILQTVEYVYETIAAVNRGYEFISWAPFDEVISDMRPRESEEVLYLERCDYEGGIWETPDVRSRLLRLRKRSSNQKRLFLNDSALARDTVLDEDLLDLLRQIHSSDALRRLDIRHARASRLPRFRFGVALYPDRGCLVAPIPAPSSYDEYLELIRYTEEPWRVFDRFPHRTWNDGGEFKAFVVADEDLASDLVQEFRKLFSDPYSDLL